MWLMSRLKWAAVSTVLLYVIFAVSAHIPLDPEVAQRMSNELASLTASINSPLVIFANNAAIALLMVVPVLGTAGGLYVIYNTGIYLSAVAITSGFPPAVLVFIPILTVYGALEFFAYGICINEGIRILLAILSKKLRAELRFVGLMVGLGIFVLFVAALLEFLILLSLQSINMIGT